MIPPAGDPMHWLFLIAGGVFAVGVLVALGRLIAGPTLPDRVVALDLIGYQVVAVLGVYSIVTQRHALLFVAMIAALILFLGTAAFSIYVERRHSP